MSEELAVGLCTAGAMIIVGLLALLGKLIVDRRTNSKSGNPAPTCPILEPVAEVKRDLEGVEKGMEQFHNRLERHMESQSKAVQGQTLVLNDIKNLLNERLPRMNSRPRAGG